MLRIKDKEYRVYYWDIYLGEDENRESIFVSNSEQAAQEVCIEYNQCLTEEDHSIGAHYYVETHYNYYI